MNVIEDRKSFHCFTIYSFTDLKGFFSSASFKNIFKVTFAPETYKELFLYMMKYCGYAHGSLLYDILKYCHMQQMSHTIPFKI